MRRACSLSRRQTLLRMIAGAGTLGLAACDRVSRSVRGMSVIDSAETLTRTIQRALMAPREALAPEYGQSDISPGFKPNGSVDPDDPDYVAARDEKFVNWKLKVSGLVEKPLQLSLQELRQMPSRTQITRHDCVEGWSCIGKWKGAPLKNILDAAGLKPATRYIALHCADQLEQTLDGSGQYYETIDLIDAYHPQTILAYEVNDEALPVSHGAPLRLRVERQLGYKMAKYVMEIEAIDSFEKMGRGKGGFWEDRGYEWYAGI